MTNKTIEPVTLLILSKVHMLEEHLLQQRGTLSKPQPLWFYCSHGPTSFLYLFSREINKAIEVFLQHPEMLI